MKPLRGSAASHTSNWHFTCTCTCHSDTSVMTYVHSLSRDPRVMLELHRVVTRDILECLWMSAELVQGLPDVVHVDEESADLQRVRTFLAGKWGDVRGSGGGRRRPWSHSLLIRVNHVMMMTCLSHIEMMSCVTMWLADHAIGDYITKAAFVHTVPSHGNVAEEETWRTTIWSDDVITRTYDFGQGGVQVDYTQ